MKLTPGKLKGLKAVSNEHGVIAAAAMDQRGSLQKSLAKEKGSTVTDAMMEEFKSLVTEVLTPHASRVHGRFGLIKILPTDNAGRIKALGALILLFRPLQIGLLRRKRTLLALYRGLLLQWIDLHQRGAVLHHLSQWTKIFVTCPSTCGIITAESRDLSVATYSVESLTGVGRATCTFTGIAGGPPACALAGALPAHPRVAPMQAIANRRRFSFNIL